MGGNAGKTVAPIDVGHKLAEEKTKEFEPSAELLGWRRILCQSHLEGFAREVAASSELLELDDKHVLLRPRSSSFVTESLVLQFSKAISDALGHPFVVEFAPDECAPDAESVSKLEAMERVRARKALIEAFRRDPFVQKCLETLNATLDEESVRAVETTEKRKK